MTPTMRLGDIMALRIQQSWPGLQCERLAQDACGTGGMYYIVHS